MAPAAFATALLLLQVAPEEKTWEYQLQSVGPARRPGPGKPAGSEESAISKTTLKLSVGVSAELSEPHSITKLSGSAVSSYEADAYKADQERPRPLKLEFVPGEARYKYGDNPLVTRKLKGAPVAVIVELREADPGCWAHLVGTDRFKKLERSKILRMPVYTVNFNTHFEAEIQVAYMGDVHLAGIKGKIKTRRYEVIRDQTRWSLYVDEQSNLVASKTGAWARGEEQFRTTYLSRADLFDSPQVKEAPKD